MERGRANRERDQKQNPGGDNLIGKKSVQRKRERERKKERERDRERWKKNQLLVIYLLY